MSIPYNPRLVILEGADGVGKSTLGRHLAKQYDGFYFHATATKSLIPAMRDYQQNLLENVQENVAAGRTVVLDRFWPSELVYGTVFRPENPYGFSYTELEDACSKLGAIYICCFSSTAIERHKIVKDAKHPYDDSSFAKVYALYEEFWSNKRGSDEYMRYDLETWHDNMTDFGRLITNRYNERIISKLGLAAEPPNTPYSGN